MKDTTRDRDEADTNSLFFMFVFYRNDPVDPLDPPQAAEGKSHNPRPAKARLPQAREDLEGLPFHQGSAWPRTQGWSYQNQRRFLKAPQRRAGLVN